MYGLFAYIIDGGSWVVERRGSITALTSTEKEAVVYFTIPGDDVDGDDDRDAYNYKDDFMKQ